MFDPPAAHSMDTVWFAVDADGCVGRFDSGEAGAVPYRAPSGGGASEPTFDVALLEAWLLARTFVREPVAATEPFGEISARIVVAVKPEAPEVGYREPGATRYPGENALAAYEPFVLHAESPRVLATRKRVPGATIDALVAAGQFQRVATLDDHDEAWAGQVFEYGNDDYGVPGAYERRGDVATPVRVGELPAELAGELDLVLPVRFADTPSVQLADHIAEAELATWHDEPPRGLTDEERAARDAQRAAIVRVQRRRALVASTVILAILGVLAWLVR